MNKRYFNFLFFLLFLGLSLPSLSAQQRGDLIAYKQIQDYSIAEIESKITELAALDPVLSTLTLPLINIQYPQKLYKIVYRTIDAHGNLTKASGLMLVPQNTSCELSTVIYSHGTTFARRDVPSYENMAEVVFGFGYAGSGYFMLMPDYVGMGSSPGLHPYVEASTLAAANIDMIRAARTIATEIAVPLRNEIFITGYSEGGHAGMATAKAIKEDGLTAEFNVGGVGVGSGPYDLSLLQFDYIANNPLYPTPQYILYVASICGELGYYVDNDDPSAFLLPPYDQLYTTHILGQTGILDWVPADWTEMFSQTIIDEMTAPNSEIRQCLQQSDVYDWFNEYDTNMYYCDTDEQVDPQCASKTRDVQRDYYDWWDLEQFDINIAWMGPLSHPDCAIPTFLDARGFFNARRTDCGNLGNNPDNLNALIIIPAYSYYNTEISFSGEHPFVHVAAHDIMGNLVEEQIIPSSATSITLDKLAKQAGVYSLKFTTGSGVEVWKTATVVSIETPNNESIKALKLNKKLNRYEFNLHAVKGEVTNIRIIDFQGNVAQDYQRKQKAITKDNIVIDKGIIPSGKYHLELQTPLKSYFLDIQF